MKRYILSTESSHVLFDSVITINIDLPFVKIDSAEDISRFPGVNQFLNVLVSMLEDTYHFEVITDTYDGVLSKGHVSNREGSSSVYIDSYYDLTNSEEVLKRLGVTNIRVPEGKIMCFIHARFSDHVLNDEGDIDHIKYVNNNASKYTSSRDVTFIYKDETFEVSERELQLSYKSALEDFSDQLDARILYWVNKANKSQII